VNGRRSAFLRRMKTRQRGWMTSRGFFMAPKIRAAMLGLLGLSIASALMRSAVKTESPAFIVSPYLRSTVEASE
jgi:hypothetical protein